MALSSAQIEGYLNRIRLPRHLKGALYKGPDDEEALSTITLLQRHHLAAIPYENVDIHYSLHRKPMYDTESVFDRVIAQQRGGLCAQVNILFVKLLQSLGFDAYCTAGRLNAATSVGKDPQLDATSVVYGPWTHILPLVIIKGQKYLVEVALNQYGSCTPIALLHNDIQDDMWPRQSRMIYSDTTVASRPNPGQSLWRMQLRKREDQPWLDICCFAETEWTFLDFEVLNTGFATMGVGWYATTVLCYRIILEDQVPVGYLLIQGNELRRHYKGETRVIQKFYSENDRVSALAREFGITLNAEERKAIKGTSTELVQDDFDYYG